MSLANKYRPKDFDDIIGQSGVVTTIKAQCESNEISPCILLCGPAGTGKTTLARIIAKCLSAEIHELDAASNNGVDDVRELQEQATRKSMLATNKVFILDECHAMSTQAWQAMLKLLEEPPVNTYFILCTTEFHKIPKTILSRVQKFYFNYITKENIISRLKYVCDKEDISATDEALNFIAIKANGCMRDALSMLDVASSANKTITLPSCAKAINEVTPIYVDDFVGAIENKFVNQATRIVHDVEEAGMSVKQFILSCVYSMVCSCETMIENDENNNDEYSLEVSVLDWLLDVYANIKPDMSETKYVEARIIIWCFGDKNDG